MRHTWHADQETTVLLHFCHHLPTDFFHIPIWMGGLGFLSISSPLTVSQQKAPLVRFLLQQLITPSGVFWLRRQAASAASHGHALRPQPRAASLSAASQRRVLPSEKQRIVRIPQPGNDEHSVKSAAQITNFNSLQSLLLICVLWEGGPFWRLCHCLRRADERRSCSLCEQRQADRPGRLGALSASPANNYALINLEKLELHYNPQKFSN